MRLGLGALIFGLSLLAVDRTTITVFERDLFRLLNDLPEAWLPPIVFVMQLGNALAAPAVSALALAVKERRMALTTILSGSIAYVAAKEVKDLVGRPRPGGLVEGVVHHGTGAGLGFVSGHTAVAAALATAAAPYLPRVWRRVAWLGVGVVGASRIYVGAHLPLDVVGGAALGWTAAAAVQLAVGTRRRAPTPEDAQAVLARSGLAIPCVTPVAGIRHGSFPFVAGPWFVKLLDPETRDRDWLFRVGRFLALRDVRAEAMLDDDRNLGEREAAMALLAHQAGCRVPTVRTVEHDGRRTWLITERIGCRTLADLAPDEISNDVLRDVWRQLVRLHGAGLVHLDLVATNVMVGADGAAWIVDFAHARSSTAEHHRRVDIAELLVTTALAVGNDRAVRAAADVVGESAIERALPALQPFSLSASTRQALRGAGAGLEDLRRAVAAHVALGDDQRLHLRVSTPVIIGTMAGAIAVAVGVAMWGLGPEVTWHATSSRWVGLAAIAAVGAWLQATVALAALSDRRLGLGVGTLVEVAGAGSNAIHARPPSLVRARYLERSGVPLPDAVTAIRRSARLEVGLLTGASAALLAVKPGDRIALAGLAAGVLGGLFLGRRHRLDREANHLPLTEWAVAITATVAELALWGLVVVAAAKATGSDVAIAPVALAGMWLVAVVRHLRDVPVLVDLLLGMALVVAGTSTAEAAMAVGLARSITFWMPAALALPLTNWLVRRLAVW